MLTLILMIVIFFALSGLMAAIDAAMLSVTGPEVEELIHQQCYGAKRLREVKHRIRDAVVVIVIATNTINVLGPVIVSHQAFELFSSRGVVVVTIVLTLGTIVFSEILPKAIGNHFAPLVARLSAPTILASERVLFPLVIPLGWLTKRFTPGTRQLGTESQIRSLVRMGHQAGHIETDENQLIHRAFVLNDRMACDIMTPIDQVRAIAASSLISQAVTEVERSEFSRYPVFGSTIDDVQGILLSRDLLKAIIHGDSQHTVLSLVVDPMIVDAKTRSDDLLVLFRDQRVHLAVVQSAGKTLGIVTLEDVLEQLVGEIDDEKDTA
ncbi:Magnesium and cobalt efflux protein CorC [Roseimaritima multifibrata]|uniref:Magnesium and cobalt efflux protein CorC n=1 Tax=Roseimaritima multifibrata TaxID=1930274 RepID=A0A517MA49_9BACT|nr:CNNM domain-containing protein [Roseimaritima multifibrata]QDS91762.1 Magnesium and cobalt efflux protein CorC [Roseimaritima multifibrata]